MNDRTSSREKSNSPGSAFGLHRRRSILLFQRRLATEGQTPLQCLPAVQAKVSELCIEGGTMSYSSKVRITLLLSLIGVIPKAESESIHGGGGGYDVHCP